MTFWSQFVSFLAHIAVIWLRRAAVGSWHVFMSHWLSQFFNGILFSHFLGPENLLWFVKWLNKVAKTMKACDPCQNVATQGKAGKWPWGPTTTNSIMLLQQHPEWFDILVSLTRIVLKLAIKWVLVAFLGRKWISSNNLSLIDCNEQKFYIL